MRKGPTRIEYPSMTSTAAPWSLSSLDRAAYSRSRAGGYQMTFYAFHDDRVERRGPYEHDRSTAYPYTSIVDITGSLQRRRAANGRNDVAMFS